MHLLQRYQRWLAENQMDLTAFNEAVDIAPRLMARYLAVPRDANELKRGADFWPLLERSLGWRPVCSCEL